MKYTALLNGDEREIEITPLDEHRFRVTVDGVTHEADVRDCEADAISLLIDNRSYDLSYSFTDDSLELNFWNQYFNMDILDERKLRMRRVKSEMLTSGPETVLSSMPGKIVRVLVSPGDEVEPGAGIIIMEAMKMENEISCKNAGIIKSVHVSAGDTVEKDVILLKIAPPESDGDTG